MRSSGCVYLLYPLTHTQMVAICTSASREKYNFHKLRVFLHANRIYISSVVLVLYTRHQLVNTSFQGIFISLAIWLCLRRVYSRNAVNNITFEKKNINKNWFILSSTLSSLWKSLWYIYTYMFDVGQLFIWHMCLLIEIYQRKTFLSNLDGCTASFLNRALSSTNWLV